MNAIERVANGAAWLDENEPGWEGRIDLASLSLSMGCRCVLGQVMPEQSYNGAMTRVHGSEEWWASERAMVWAFEHGFNLSPEQLRTTEPMESSYAELDEAWIALIKERFDSGNFSDA